MGAFFCSLGLKLRAKKTNNPLIRVKKSSLMQRLVLIKHNL